MLNLKTLASIVLMTIPLAGHAAELCGGDHHMHLRSSDISAMWVVICERMPPACLPGMAMPPAPNTADEVIAALDAAGLEKGVVLSLAYFYGNPEMADTEFNSAELVRKENAFTAAEVARYPERLVGFFSVNPLADYALDEVRYQVERGALVGLKLHLANSAVDFGNPEHLAKLRAIFEVLNEHGLPVVIHLRNRSPEYGAAAARVFIDEVAAHAPNVTLQLAHLVGWGGYDPATDGAIQAFLDAIAEGKLDRSQVYFEISGIIAPNLPAPVQVKDEALPALADRLREIGIDRILFGTDWDVLGTPQENIELLKSRLALTEGEWDQLLSNRASYFE